MAIAAASRRVASASSAAKMTLSIVAAGVVIGAIWMVRSGKAARFLVRAWPVIQELGQTYGPPLMETVQRVFGIVSTGSYAWTSPRTIATLAGGAAVLVSFTVIEARFASNPIVPLRTFRRRTLTLGNAQSTVVGAVVFGSYFFLSLYLQDVKHYSPLRAGLAFLPMGLMTFGGALVASRLVKRVGIRRQLVIAPLVTAVAVFWLSHLTAHSSYLGSLLVPLLLVGASIGVTFVPMTMAATMGVPPAESGLASGLLNTSRQVGGALGLAVLATIATAATHDADGLGAPHLAALTHGYTRGFLVIAAISVLGAVTAAFLSTSTPSQDGRGAAADESELVAVTL